MAKILIVDGDNETAKRLAHELKQAGHACAVRNDGRGVVEIAGKSDLDMLILDVMLPGISGFEICRQIRRDKKVYALPVVFLSEMSDEAEVEHGLAQGADGYITKPVDMDAFLQRIGRMLEQGGESENVDPVTGLPNSDGIRKLIQQHVTRNEVFALLYVEVMYLKELMTHSGEAGREKALRHLTRALRHNAENLALDYYDLGHLGGGHFIAIVPGEDAELFSKKVLSSWQKHMSRFCESDAIGFAYTEALKRDEVLDLSLCVTFRAEGEHASAQDILDTVSRIHKTSYNAGQAGIHMDRRVL